MYFNRQTPLTLNERGRQFSNQDIRLGSPIEEAEVALLFNIQDQLVMTPVVLLSKGQPSTGLPHSNYKWSK